MLTLIFFGILIMTVMQTNKKNEAEVSSETLSFSRKDSAIIFVILIASFGINKLLSLFDPLKYWLTVGLLSVGFFILLVVLNTNREKKLKKKRHDVIHIFESLKDVYGKTAVESIDMADLPFTFEYDPKTGTIGTIVLDSSRDGNFSDDRMTYVQFNMNKYFPEHQWITKTDYQGRTITLQGLPKPPKIAMFPGTDYRPTGWIPLGINGFGEVGWNIGKPKDLGMSSYIMDDGESVGSVESALAPQALVLGGTGGGKAIFVGQIVSIRKRT